MKRILTFLLLFSSLGLFAQKQPTMPPRTNGITFPKDSSLAIGYALIPVYIAPSFAGYTDRPGTNFGLRTSNNRLNVRGSGAWLEFPSYTEVQSMIAAIPSSPVSSVFGRTGAVTAQSADYSSFYYPLTGNPSGFLTSTPVSSVFGRTGVITAQAGDYSGFYAPATGSANYVNIQTATPQSGGFNLSSTGTANAFFAANMNSDVFQNRVNQFNSAVATGTTGTSITRNIADANPVMVVNNLNASSTGDVLRLQKGGVNLLTVAHTGQTTISGGGLIVNVPAVFSADVNIPTGSKLYLIDAPVAVQDATNKQYVDSKGTGYNFTASGNGSATAITIPHGLSGISGTSVVIVSPKNSASAGVTFSTIDATNVTVNYTVAPVLGSSNLSYSIFIKP